MLYMMKKKKFKSEDFGGERENHKVLWKTSLGKKYTFFFVCPGTERY